MDHRIEIVTLRDRSTPICSCGNMDHREFFGDRRTANAANYIYRHLESSLDDGYFEAEYQIKLSGDMECPICKSDLDLNKKDHALLAGNKPSVINCIEGHEFDAYLKDNTLFLFLDGSSGPFSVSH